MDTPTGFSANRFRRWIATLRTFARRYASLGIGEPSGLDPPRYPVHARSQ